MYTAPDSVVSIVTSMVFTNASDSGGSVSVDLDGVPLVSQMPVGARSTVTLDVSQVLDSGISASGSSDIHLHICGVEVPA